MEYTLQIRLSAYVQISDEEFSFLERCCKHHYSHDCKELIEPGGFLYGWANMRKAYRDAKKQERPTKELTFREMDTLLKVLEIAPYFSDAETVGVIWVALNKFFHGILRQMNEVGPLINDKLEKGEIK